METTTVFGAHEDHDGALCTFVIWGDTFGPSDHGPIHPAILTSVVEEGGPRGGNPAVGTFVLLRAGDIIPADQLT